MRELLLKKSKYNTWGESHTFDNCKLKRKEYGHFLSSYITGEHDGFVLNLNGSWGTGKTEFLKRMYTHLLSEDYPCIYIDAWESDFSKEPLTVVTSELINQLKAFNSDINGEQSLKEVKKSLMRALKGTAVGLAGGLTKYLIDDGTVGASAMHEWLNDDSFDYMDLLTEEHAAQVNAIVKVRENLTSLAKVLESTYSINLPIVILVDELDRCRPTYAIEMLEVIKHFFKTERFVFVIATDTEQLSHSISAVYGENFNSNQYLKRFFDRKATLPEPDIGAYLDALKINYPESSDLILFPRIHASGLTNSINKTITFLSEGYDLQIRDIDQLTNKFLACLRLAGDSKASVSKVQYLNFPALLIGLIEYEKHQDVYNKRTKFDVHSSNMKNPNVKISNDLTLQKFVDTSMHNITFRVLSSEYCNMNDKLLNSPNDLYGMIQSESSLEYKSFLQNTADNIAAYEGGGSSCSYWSWDDMKRAIELAGTIQ